MPNSSFLLVTTKDGAVIGKLRERDGISDCRLTEKQNDNSTLTFNMLTSSEKYAWLADPENLIAAGDRVFSAIYDGDSLTEKKDSGNKNTASFGFVERQCLLDKRRFMGSIVLKPLFLRKTALSAKMFLIIAITFIRSRRGQQIKTIGKIRGSIENQLLPRIYHLSISAA